MKKSMILGLVLGFTTAAYAKENKEAQQPTKEQMEACTKAAAPGEHHKILNGMIGKWKHTTRFWMEPNTEAQEMKGTNENKWILGGRFVEDRSTGKADPKNKMPAFEGLGILGYDNMREEYTSVWVDNMSSGIMRSTGEYDAETNTITEKGVYSDPMSGDKEKSFRAEIKFVDKNHYTYSFYTKDKSGDEFKSFEVSYERVKSMGVN